MTSLVAWSLTRSSDRRKPLLDGPGGRIAADPGPPVALVIQPELLGPLDAVVGAPADGHLDRDPGQRAIGASGRYPPGSASAARTATSISATVTMRAARSRSSVPAGAPVPGRYDSTAGSAPRGTGPRARIRTRNNPVNRLPCRHRGDRLQAEAVKDRVAVHARCRIADVLPRWLAVLDGQHRQETADLSVLIRAQQLGSVGPRRAATEPGR